MPFYYYCWCSLFDIPCYDFVSKPRRTGKGGGVAAYVSDSISWLRRDDLEDDTIECIWLEIILKHTKKFFILELSIALRTAQNTHFQTLTALLMICFCL